MKHVIRGLILVAVALLSAFSTITFVAATELNTVGDIFVAISLGMLWGFFGGALIVALDSWS